MNTHKHVSLFAALLFVATGCLIDSNSGDDEFNGRVVKNSAILPRVMDAPQTTVVDGIELSVEAFVWRDFQPSIPESGNGMMSSVTLESVNGETISGRFKITQQFVVHTRNNSIWIPDMSASDSSRNDATTRHKISRNGPLWETGTKILVGISIKDLQTDQDFMLSIKDLSISRTS